VRHNNRNENRSYIPPQIISIIANILMLIPYLVVLWGIFGGNFYITFIKNLLGG
jgi:hypothetical protein